MVLRCLWAFSANGTASESGSVVFWLYYIVGEALILSGLLVYALAGVAAFRKRNKQPRSSASEPLLQKGGDNVPLAYRE
jgi:hypothetical protein